MAILNAHQRFALPALAPALNWLGWILGTLFLVPSMGIHGLAWGVVLGAALHLVIQLPGLRRLHPSYRTTLGRRDPAVREVGKLMLPRVLGVAAVQINFLVNVILASGMPEGSLTGLTLGFAIMLMPQVIIAQGLAIAALPTFSEHAASGRLDKLRSSLTATLRSAIFLMLPASLGLIILRRPVVSMLFERGQFDSHSTDLVAWALLWYSVGLIGHAIVEITSRAFYAQKNTRTPVVIGVAAMALNVFLSLSLSAVFAQLGLFPHGGLALANSLATTLEAVVLLWLLRTRVDFSSVGSGFFRTVVASVALIAALALWLSFTQGRSVWFIGLGGAVVGAAVFWVVSLLLRTPEARDLPAALLVRRQSS